MKLILLSMVFSLFGSERCEKLNSKKCLVKIINHFSGLGSTIIVPSVLHFESTLKMLSLDSKFLFLTTDYSKFLKQDLLTFDREIYLIEFYTFNEIERILEKFKKLKFWNLRSKFLLIYHRNRRNVDTIEEMFAFLWSVLIYDMIFIIPSTPTLIYAWYPYFPKVTVMPCTTLTPLRNEPLTIDEVPRRIVPHPLRAEVVFFPPYVISKTEGGDIQIAKELAKMMKTDLVVTHSDKPYDFGFVLPNKTVTGMFGQAYYGKVDMAIAGLILLPDRYALLDASYVYHNEFYQWCVPRAPKVPSWRHVFGTMNLTTWILIFTAYFIITVLLWCLSLLKEEEGFYKFISNCFLNNFAILLGTPASSRPKSRSGNLFALFWVLMCLILDVTYTTKFISLVDTGVDEEQIDTMTELLDSDLEMWMKHSSFNIFGDNPLLQKVIRKGYNTCHNVFTCLKRVAHFRNASVFVSNSFIQYVNKHFLDKDDLSMIYCFDSSVDIAPMAVGMRKGFPLKDFVDKILARFVEGGFTKFWTEQTFLKPKVGEEEQVDEVQSSRFFTVLVFCWTVGMTAAGGVFVLEILLKRAKFCIR